MFACVADDNKSTSVRDIKSKLGFFVVIFLKVGPSK